MRDSFIFYEIYSRAIERLEDGEQLQLYRAITDYGLHRKEPTFRGALAGVWDLIQSKLDESWRRSQSGKKGGAPKGNANATKQANSTKNNQIQAKSSKINQTDHTPPSEAIDYERLAELFNTTTGGRFGTIKTPLSDNRKKMIKARVTDHGKEAFVKVIEMATKSEFLSGQNSRGFMMTFDWMIKPTNFEKILSGNYNSSANNGKFNKNNPIGVATAKNYETEL